MPHRPEGQAQAALSPGVVLNSSMYTPPRVTGSTAAAIMRQHTSDDLSTASQKPTTSSLQYGVHSSGVVTPTVKKNGGLNWLTASNKSSDSTDRSTTTTTDDNRSIATLATEDEREATASALLMVAKAAEREHQQHYLKGMVVDSSNVGDNRPTGVVPAVSASASTCSASTVPLKKRKKKLDILMRHHQNVDKEACHVSPVSHDGGNSSSSGNLLQSYDSKDLGLSSPKGETTQELLDSSKVHSTTQIGAGAALPVEQVLIPHFPTVLHQVLANKELATIIRWLPDGEAWRVENWNAMRRQVLPKYFADLRDENGSSCGTIDAFLHNIDAWGMDEIKNGPNAGAYRHNLFIRGAQKLCVKMRFNSDMTTDNVNSTNKKGFKTVSPGRGKAAETERMMLQVPMLATADSKKQLTQPSNKRPRNENTAMGLSGHGPLHWPYSNEPASGVMWGAGAQFNPHIDIPNARAFGMRAAVTMNGNNPYGSQNGSYIIDPRMHLLRVPTSDSMTMNRQQPFQYNPPQVRSGRGALRGIASATQSNRGSMTPSPATTPSFRHGFPVSNRGKGSRKSAACRTALSSSTDAKKDGKNSLTASSSDKAQTMVGGVSLSEAQRIGNSVKGGVAVAVAVAISRTTKRKLPLSGSKKGVEAEHSLAGASIATSDAASFSKH